MVDKIKTRETSSEAEKLREENDLLMQRIRRLGKAVSDSPLRSTSSSLVLFRTLEGATHVSDPRFLLPSWSPTQAQTSQDSHEVVSGQKHALEVKVRFLSSLVRRVSCLERGPCFSSSVSNSSSVTLILGNQSAEQT